jgi:hypothetical protein
VHTASVDIHSIGRQTIRQKKRPRNDGRAVLRIYRELTVVADSPASPDRPDAALRAE